jgi:hypothetical protein
MLLQVPPANGFEGASIELGEALFGSSGRDRSNDRAVVRGAVLQHSRGRVREATRVHVVQACSVGTARFGLTVAESVGTVAESVTTFVPWVASVAELATSVAGLATSLAETVTSAAGLVTSVAGSAPSLVESNPV